MYAYGLEELAWVIARERRDEARQMRPHLVRPEPREPLRSRLARALVHLGMHLDPAISDTSHRALHGCH